MEHKLPRTIEEKVIGTLLAFPYLINKSTEILTPEMFTSPVLKLFYECILSVYKKAGGFDLETVTLELTKKTGSLQAVSYITEISGLGISDAMFQADAKEVSGVHAYKRFREFGQFVAELGANQDSDIIEKVQNEYLSLSEIINPKGRFFVTKTMNDWMKEADGEPVPNMLFSELWHEKELCILFSYTGYGKSTLAMQVAIAISEGLAMEGFRLEAKQQKVLYFDFELSAKQLQGRYSKREGKEYTDTYKFNSNFTRTVIDILNLPTSIKFEDYLIQQLEQEIVNSGVKVVIIDNLTCVKGDVEAAKDAIPFMRGLNILKRQYGLSILVLAHTPKRNEAHPLTLNDLSGSSALSKFCDSCFAIGKSPKDANIRYLKQLKEKETECLYGSDNVIICHLEQVGNMRSFTFAGFGSEIEYLKAVPEEEARVKESMVLERHREGRSLRDIGKELGISYSTVKRILNKRGKNENPSF